MQHRHVLAIGTRVSQQKTQEIKGGEGEKGAEERGQIKPHNKSSRPSREKRTRKQKYSRQTAEGACRRDTINKNRGKEI